MNCLKRHWGLALVLGTVIVIYLFLPLGTAIRFGGDEGYEVMTGFLMSKGYPLYKQIWNDQPPAFVLFLSWGFKLFGPTVLVARLISAVFGLILFGAFYQVVCKRLGNWPALTATFLLLASPAVLELSVSAMQEVPAFGLAMVSVLMLFQWSKERKRTWLVASGIVMAFALQIKLTAILTISAILVEILLTSRIKRNLFLSLLAWSASCGIVFALITAIWGQGSFQSSYRAHFAEHSVVGLERPQDFPFQIPVLINHLECVLAAMVGLLLVFWRKRWREFVFPIVMLITAIGIHAFHRPWWMYYYLHLAIPLAWLAAFALSEIFDQLADAFGGKSLRFSSPAFWGGLVLCTLAGLVLVRSERRLESGVKDLRERPRIDSDPIIAKMKLYAPQTHWAYVQYGNEMYPFHAQLPMPPELALVTLKRFWSDQISESEIVEICKRYKVEQLLLPLAHADEWNELLRDYQSVSQEGNLVLYLSQPAAKK